MNHNLHGANQAPRQTRQPLSIIRRGQRKSYCLIGCLIFGIVPAVCIASLIIALVFFPPEPINLLILGVDARPGQGYLTRTDSIMLLNVTPGEFKVTLLSIPRDVYITVPGYGEQRINTINVLGEQEAKGNGPALIKASIYESFNIRVDRYLRVDFQAFAAIIDAVGGIDIDVPNLIVDYEYPTADGGTITLRFEPGWQHMDGERALQFARTRHQDDDYHRSARQQQVVDALLKKLISPIAGIYIPRIWLALNSHSDTDLTFWDLIQVGPGLLLGWHTRDQRVIQREDLIGMQSGYWIPNYAHLAPWIMERFE